MCRRSASKSPLHPIWECRGRASRGTTSISPEPCNSGLNGQIMPRSDNGKRPSVPTQRPNRLQPEAYRMYSLRDRTPLSSNGALWLPRKPQLLLPDDGFSLPEIVSGDSSIMCYYSRWFSICQAPKRPCFRRLKLQMLHRRNISKA